MSFKLRNIRTLTLQFLYFIAFGAELFIGDFPGKALVDIPILIAFSIFLFSRARRRSVSKEIYWSKLILMVIGWAYLVYMAIHNLDMWKTPFEAPPVRWSSLKEAWFFIGAGIICLSSPGFLRGFVKIQSQPARLILISYTAAALLGSILLVLPVCLKAGQSISQLDAFFTAVSALSGTGLVVKNTAETFSVMGYVVILVLIQMGGVGVITFSALLLLFIGKELGFHEKTIQDDTERLFYLGDLKHFLFAVAAIMVVFQGLGAIILFPWMSTKFDGFWMILFHSVFQSVSAFCTTGFTTLVSGMEEARNQSLPLITIGTLSVVGMFGLPLIVNLYRLAFPKKIIRRLEPYSKLELWMAVSVLLFGTLSFAVVEFNNPAHSGIKDLLLNSFFMSSMRNAGFNSIPVSELLTPTIFVLMTLMMVGGAPMSTAGGLKTSTIGIIFLFVKSFLMGTQECHFSGRSVPFILLSKAISLVVIYFSVLFVGFIVLVLTQPHDALPILFETISALSVNGFSFGITPSFDTSGKVVVIMLMMTGRIGMLTVVYAFIRGRKPERFKRPIGEFYVG